MHVTFSYDEKYRVPASAKAAIVAPSLVSDRYVQLLPVYEAGPALAAGTRIPLERTAVPVELDRVSQSLDDLMVALGPDGANKNGALNELLRTSAANLDGNGDKLNGTVARPLDRAVDPVRQPRRPLRHREEPPVLHLDARHQQRAGAPAQLRPRDRRDPAERGAREPQGDPRQPRRRGRRGVGLRLGQPGAAQEQPRPRGHGDRTPSPRTVRPSPQLLENAPVALSNLQNAYHPETGTLDTRNNAKGLDDPLLLVCSILTGPDAARATRKLCDSLQEGAAAQAAHSAVAAERRCAAGQPAAERPRQPAWCRPHARRTARRLPMTYAVTRTSPRAPRRRTRRGRRAEPAVARRGSRVQRLRPAAPGRRRHRRRLVHRHGRVRRRARPRAPVVGQGQPGDRRLRRGHPGDRLDRDGPAAAARRRRAARQRDGRAQADLAPRREVRRARRPDRRAAPGPPRTGRPHPARAHEPQPRGRGGARRDVAAAQRWWRRAAEDHRGRAQQRAARPHRRRQGPRHAAEHLRRWTRRAEGRDRPGHRQHRPALGDAGEEPGQDRRRPSTSCPRA